MRKRLRGKKLSRSKTARDALYRSLTKALFEHGKIETTQAKAKGVIPYMGKLIRIAKKGDLSARRRVLSALANDRKTTDLIINVATNLKSGSFIKLIPLPPRRGDSALMARLELTQLPVKKEENARETKSKTEKKTNASKDKKVTSQKPEVKEKSKKAKTKK